MSKYEIVQVATLYAGILELTEAQAARRKHALKPVAKGKYEITSPVQFKVGETIGYEGDLPKAMGTVMVGEAEAKKSDAKKAKQAKQAKEAEAELAAKKQAAQDEIEQLQIMLEAANDAEKPGIEDQIAVKQAELASIE